MATLPTPKVLDHTPQSPDLNSIEHFGHLDRQVRKRSIRNKNMLKSVTIEEWQKIYRDITKMLMESIFRRLHTVIKAKGKSTKY